MPDVLLGASAPDAGIAVFATVTTDLVREIQRRHDLSPTASAAVGRLVTGAVLFGASLKGRERVSLQISGDGPIGRLSADAWLLDEATIGARGYTRNAHVDLPIDARGKFDVGGAVGSGVLQVTKAYESGQPYVGVVPLQTGEIAEDLAMYLAQSEQIPSIVALGVLANPSGVIAAGGVIAQVLPGADEAVVATLEQRALAMPPVTKIISTHADAQSLLNEVVGDLPLRGHRSLDVRFACLCSAGKVEAALLGLGADELRSMIGQRNETEATCEYCKKTYVFTSSEIAGLIERAG
jgi:molecular chaperone Hsp33